ncbi:GNAT family N-acetyltransferase [Rhizobium sp. L1K21]|uniref:GNAT family N-acetyltransferase n=1 Tax=Rhizobium sp. L1K21 TaxID=2954933 RepID=UPI002093CF8E|nr:N-acetyltransferase [Rhizobium sp. L1K21]MCO6186886.1 N-acetyltransferase [Rhizobium sp. L1K21]
MLTVLDILPPVREATYPKDDVLPVAPKSVYTIERETPADVVARERLLDIAMGPDRRKKSSEKLRRNRVPAEGLAFVARDENGQLIGTVRLWDVHAGITPKGAPLPALLLGPLAVDSAYEGRGVGGALMRTAVMEAKRLGHGAVLLVGDAPYYERFGFFADKTETLMMPGPFQRDRFLALELIDGWLQGASGMLTAAGIKLSRTPLRKAA